MLLSGKKTIKEMNLKFDYKSICEGMKSVVPTSCLVLFAYFVSNLLEDIDVGTAIGNFISSFNLPLIAVALILPLFTAILGMLIPGSTQIKIFGGIIISVVAAAGGNPMLAAGMLPCICGAMHGVTPPYCACVYTGMGIAQSELGPTLKNCFVWISVHYILSVAMIMGWIPVYGLI